MPGEGECGSEKILAVPGSSHKRFVLLDAEKTPAQQIGRFAVVVPGKDTAEVGFDFNHRAVAVLRGEGKEFEVFGAGAVVVVMDIHPTAVRCDVSLKASAAFDEAAESGEGFHGLISKR